MTKWQLHASNGGVQEQQQQQLDDRTTTTPSSPTNSSSTTSNQSKNRNRRTNQHPPKKREPWRAGYHVSKKTQGKIQQAAEDRGNVKRTGVQRASAVLQTLLDTPPDRCNAANLVCALTLSAKVLGTTNSNTNEDSDSFRSLLLQALSILHTLVQQKCLSSRQLCNAVWAIGKHYDRDPLLLPPSSKTETIFNNQILVSETWDLNEKNSDDDDSVSELTPEQLVDAAVEGIARQLTEILHKESTLAYNSMEQQQNGNANTTSSKGPLPPKETKLGEICMAAWAYGILRPRQRPPGWLRPPQMGKLQSFDRKEKENSRRGDDFITFEQWTVNDDNLGFLNQNNNNGDDDREERDVADELFDAIGEALCRPIMSNNDPASNMTNQPARDDPHQQFDGDMMPRLSDCTWSEIANVAWAFERRGRSLSVASETLLQSLSREASRRLQTGGQEARSMLSRDISQLIWALGTLQQDNFRLAHDLVALTDDFSAYMGLGQKTGSSKDLRPLENWSCPDIVQTISALSHARIDDSELLLVLFQEAHCRIATGICTDPQREYARRRFLAWEVCVLLWANARLYLTSSDGDVYEQFPATAVSCIASAVSSSGSLSEIGIGPQEQANLAWALTVLEHFESDEAIQLLQSTFIEAASVCKQEGLIQLEHAHQLWQALFLLEEESPAAVTKVPKWFREVLSDKWNIEKSRKKISSARHKSLSQCLNLMGVDHYNEHDEDIDVAIVLKPQASWAHQTNVAGESSKALNVAVEFDGPNHFTRTRIPRGETKAVPVRALGHTVLKYRLLKRKGWTVIRVPYYEFDKIPFWASMERQRYLQRLLKTHANIRFSDVDISEYRSLAPNRKTRFD